jgi:hypothetical protein
MYRDRIPYRVLRGLGASPEEALETLLRGALEDQPSRLLVLAENLPGSMNPKALQELLRRYEIHPLSLILQLGTWRRARRWLRRLGLVEDYAHWLRPWGLHIRGDQLRALPAGLVIMGEARVEDCPRLSDLGEGLTLIDGTLLIRRCPRLRRLPDGLTTNRNGHITLIDCLRVEHLGAGTSIEGVLFVQECPRFQDQGMVERHSLDDELG